MGRKKKLNSWKMG